MSRTGEAPFAIPGWCPNCLYPQPEHQENIEYWECINLKNYGMGCFICLNVENKLFITQSIKSL